MSIENSQKILSMQLDWVKTADSKIPPIFAINLAMLGVIVALIKTLSVWTIFQAIITTLCVLPLLASILFLAISMFPKMSGPKGSIIFFGGITKKSENQYIDAAQNISDADYEKDILFQTYRNAEIAEEKYKNIKFSFISSFASVPFWLLSIYILSN